MSVYTGTLDAGTVDTLDWPDGVIDGGAPDTLFAHTIDGGGPFTVTEQPEVLARPARWQFEAIPAPSAAADPVALTAAHARKATFRLLDASVCSFTIDGRSDQAAALVELETDIVIRRNGRPLLRGRLGATADDLDADRHDLEATAVDYRGLLDRRIIYDDDTRTFTQVDAETIAWRLIEATQAKTGGQLGIRRRPGQLTGVKRDRTYPAGKSVGEAIWQLSELSDGFDWDISPDLEFQVFHPSRGYASPLVLEYGGTVSHVRRGIDTGEFANALRVSGAEDDDDAGPDPEIREADGLADDPAGRFDVQHGETDIAEQPTLSDRADYLIGRRSTLRGAYTVTLRKGVWSGPEDLWVGDVALLVIQSGRLDVMEAQRVYELTVALDDDGNETVTATLGRTDPLSRGRRERDVQRRLKQLERR